MVEFILSNIRTNIIQTIKYLTNPKREPIILFNSPREILSANLVRDFATRLIQIIVKISIMMKDKIIK
tara:strand:- start:8 stop:211 length:204 start_codon:yes stop_codon:yes gene_type:complete